MQNPFCSTHIQNVKGADICAYQERRLEPILFFFATHLQGDINKAAPATSTFEFE